MQSNTEIYRIALTNPAKQHDCCIYYFDKITLTWIMKRVGLMMLTLRDGDSDGLEMPASLGSLTIHFRHMTERGLRSGGTESGQVLRVTSHIVLSSRGVNDRSRLD